MFFNSNSKVSYKNKHFLIMSAPDDNTINTALQDMKDNNVKILVRTCEPTYTETLINDHKIDVVNLAFPDGQNPPQAIIKQWTNLIKIHFKQEENKDTRIGIHCVAGLGRAPVLVGIALIEEGMKPHDAINFIRERRQGALNHKQADFLLKYRRKEAGVACQCAIF